MARGERTGVRIWTGLAVLCAVAAPTDAHAYLDPGTGSFVFQLMIAGALGAIFTARTYWQRIKLWFQRSRRPDEPK